MTNAETIKAMLQVCDIIEETAREAGPLGAPSGMVYMALNSKGCSLDTYNTIIQAMTSAGRITVSGDCIHATGAAAAANRDQALAPPPAQARDASYLDDNNWFTRGNS